MKKKIALLILPIFALSACEFSFANIRDFFSKKEPSNVIEDDTNKNNEEENQNNNNEGEENQGNEGGEEENNKPNDFLTHLESLEAKNYTVTMNDNIYEYLGEDIINTKFAGVPYQGGYIRKEDVGIFDYVIFANDVVEIQGMISLNTEISPLDLLANPEYLFRIDKNKWKIDDEDEKVVSLNISSLTSQDRNFIAWSFDIDSNISSVLSINSVSATYKESLTFTVNYKDRITNQNTSKSFEISKIGETSNEPITTYLESGSFEKKDDWTYFQKTFLNQYELGDLDFLSSFTIGVSVDFSYLNMAGIVNVYDLYGSPSQVEDIADELYDLDYEILESANDILVALCKVSDEHGKVTHAKKISFRYIPYEELSYGEKVTCPNGYTQLTYSHSIYYEPTDLAGVNEALTSNSIPTLDDSEMIRTVMFSDVTELYNAEWKLMIEEANEEDGIEEEILDVLAASYVIHIYPQGGTSLNDVNVYAKAYLEKLINAGFRNTTLVFNEFLGITSPVADDEPYEAKNHANRAKIDSVNDRIIYVEVSSYDYSYSGYLEVIVEIYTRYGVEKLI